MWKDEEKGMGREGSREGNRKKVVEGWREGDRHRGADKGSGE